MKHGFQKSLVWVLLAAILVSSFAFAAVAGAETTLPTVYLYGYGCALFEDGTDPNSKMIFPVQMPEDFSSQVINRVKGPLAKGLVLHRWDAFHQTVIDTYSELYGPMALDQSGELPNRSGTPEAVYTYPLDDRKSEDGYALSAYHFGYDWRLDPFAVADSLQTFIQNVCAATGAPKVNLIGRCLGANILLAYMQAYGCERVARVCFYAPGFKGFECIGALFSGDMDFDVDAIPDYLSNAGKDQLAPGDSPIYDLLIAALEYLNAAKTLNIGEAVFDQYLIPEFKKYILPEIMRSSFATFPSFWSFIGDEYYEEAKRVIFGGQEDAWAGLIEKADHYHKDVMLQTDKILTDAVKQGTECFIIVKYGSRMAPIVKDASMQSDSTVSTTNSSHGATTAPLYETFSDEFVKGVQVANGGKYLSPDRQIDASTCLLRDHTWFVKNLYHHKNPDDVECMIAALFNHKGYPTVFDLKEYPQYLSYDQETDTVTPLREDAPAPQAPKYSYIKTKINLLKRIIRLVKTSR